MGYSNDLRVRVIRVIEGGAAARAGSAPPTAGKIPQGPLEDTTFIAGLPSTALTAPSVIDGPMNGNAYLAYVEQVLAPSLKPGDIVVLDLSALSPHSPG